ncbi:O-antigen ligase [Nocardioides sp. R-C-SC26]|uniref:O-antigen ligase family protein n=1 Tax=Nocardioides sp. R-C-SC26 TaxID=2870414 RepID=UPI001E56B97F|nr:O-antigen ligase family protein [Nocardioides sp. R-C-SC26]
MTALALPPRSRTSPDDDAPASDGRWMLAVASCVLGVLLILTWLVARSIALSRGGVSPDGMLAGGVALIVSAPFCRNIVDTIVVSCPFMFYMLSPIGGALTVGSSDALMPFFIGAMAIGYAIHKYDRREFEPIPIALPLLILSGLTGAATTVLWTVFSPDFLLARAVADLFKLAICLVYMVVVAAVVRRSGWDAAVRALRLWAWTATVLSVGSLMGVTGAITVVPSDGFRSYGYFGDANLYAGYLLVSLAIVIFLALERPSPVLPAQALLIVGGVVMTGSRGGLLSLGLLVVFSVVVINSARLRIAITILGGLLTLAGAWLLGQRDSGVQILGLDRLFSATDTRSVEEDPRFALWRLAVEKWAESPLWGIGPGQFERFSGESIRTLKSTGVGYVTHNSFLFFLVSFGLIGFVLFVFLIAWVVKYVFSIDSISRSSRWALIAGLVAITSQMMTLNLQNLRYVWIYFGLLLGMATIARPLSGGRRAEYRGSQDAGAPAADAERLDAVGTRSRQLVGGLALPPRGATRSRGSRDVGRPRRGRSRSRRRW